MGFPNVTEIHRTYPSLASQAVLMFCSLQYFVHVLSIVSCELVHWSVSQLFRVLDSLSVKIHIPQYYVILSYRISHRAPPSMYCHDKAL